MWCVACGAAADAFCARCGVTPYCSPRCQRRDWAARHSGVCHNLAISESVESPSPTVVSKVQVPPVAPLRRPRSSSRHSRDEQSSPAPAHDNANKKFVPAGHKRYHDTRNQDRHQDRNQTPRNQDHNQTPRNQDHNQTPRNQDRNQERGRYDRGRPQQRQGYSNGQETSQQRGRNVTNNEDEGEDWGAAKKESTPVPITPKPAPVAETKTTPSPTTPKPEPVVEKKPALKLLTAADTTPVPRAKPKVEEVPLVPEKCVLDVVEAGSTLLVSVEEGGGGAALHDSLQEQYLALCEEYLRDCEADKESYQAPVGLACSVRGEDGLWYRARRISSEEYALVDCARIVRAKAVRRLPMPYIDYPEFAVQLKVDDVKAGDNLKCVIDTKTSDGKCQVTVTNVETEQCIGKGVLERWRPTIQYPEPVAQPTSVQPPTPHPVEVPRPNLADSSEMFLLHCESNDLFLIPADEQIRREMDMIEQDVALYALNASPLKEPPCKGDLIIAKFTDGNPYRALCKRTNVKQNKYLLEYIEYGNAEISSLERLYPCPPQYDLTSRPALTRRATLKGVPSLDADVCKKYLDSLKDTSELLVLSLPDGKKEAASGSEVILTVAKNKENVNKKIEDIIKPDWKKLEEDGGNVFDMEVLMLSDVQYSELPTGETSLRVVDASVLPGGALAVADTTVDLEDAALQRRIDEYCNSSIAREPYLPRYEELCLAQSSPDGLWLRAVLCEQAAGGVSAAVLYLDRGALGSVPAAALRKFPRGLLQPPVAVANADIHGFPKEPTEAQLAAAREYLQLKPDGSGGQVKVTRCEKIGPGEYVVHVPELIKILESI